MLSPEVAEARASKKPLVALESTLVAHGLPWPQNLDVARELEETVRMAGAVPATIAVVDGRPWIGLEDRVLARIAHDGRDVAKAGATDLAVHMARGTTAATTVSATAVLAEHAGIRVFATGGIGGVHRRAAETFDESADLGVLAGCRITVVSAGVKSILDIGATLERLETLGVTVLVFGSERFPAFWLTDSGHTVDAAVRSAAEIAEVMRAGDELALPGGILVANPLPESAQLDPALHDRLLVEALGAAETRGVRGKAITPFLLDYIHEHTRGASVAVNLEIVRGNCALGAEIACAFAGRRA